ncbi:CWF19-like protein 2 isoform X2 [Ornithodoros turicata]|uniref:CWF19-like protein 2 isoform X2 n=1 Tax=Ornithodoros turicata TaxID=34597 RepID=UPI0031396C13
MNKVKKHKKEKKKHKKLKAETSESADSSSNDEWVEAGKASTEESKPPPMQKRDEWMDMQDSFIPTFTTKDYRAEKKAKRREEVSRVARMTDTPGTHERELNPYWKEGGTGLPQEEQPKELGLTQSNIGDGGLKWLRRAYRRIQEQAEEEGRPVEEIAAQRYGSLEKLQSMIREAEQRCGVGNSGRDRDRRHYDRRDSRHARRTPQDTQEERYHASHRKSSASDSKFRKPLDDDGNDKPRSQLSRMLRPSESEEGSSCQSWRSERRSSSKPSWMKKEYYEEEAKDTRKRPSPVPARQKKDHPAPVAQTAEEQPKPAEETNQGATKLLSDMEMNALGAKLIKAELLGNTALYKKLKEDIERARAVREAAGNNAEGRTTEQRGQAEVVVLTKTDHRGMARPLPDPIQGSGKKKIKAATHDRDGERTSYFADDNRFSLKEMFQREKATTAEDQNLEFARLAGKVKASTSQEDFDDAATDVAARFDSSARQDAHDRMRAITEHKKMTKSLEKCKYCLESSEMRKHLIVAIGLKTYLCLPPYLSLTEGHCLIVPQHHVTSGTLVDEDVWLEMQIFRKGLTRMFEDMEQDTVFMETAMGFRHHPHTVLECIPVPKDVGALAPMYFKKAILESETEWAQNKKLVDLSQKGLRNSIPRGLPYFSVDFGLQSGFAHVIEDEKEFPWYFGKEIIGGMLDLEPRLWKKMQPEKFDDQRKKVLQFAEWWKPYDWTERVKSQLKES